MIISLELSSYCSKGCSICSRSSGYKHLTDMNMSIATFNHIINKLPANQVISCHGRGSSEQNPDFEVMTRALSRDHTLVIDTNGDFLDDIDYKAFATVTVSTFDEDVMWKDQLKKIIRFKDNSKNPRLLLRINGKIKDKHRMVIYKELFKDNIVHRQIHSKKGSYNYEENEPVKAEHGICLCLIGHPVIWADGNVSTCIRYDNEQQRLLGNIILSDWDELINSGKRMTMLKEHIKTGTSRFCGDCSYRGIPVSR